MPPIPLYVQIEKALREGIAKGDIVGENGLLPSEDELLKIFDVSRCTIRKALSELVSDRLIIRRAGKGTFLLPKEKKILFALVGNLDEIVSQNSAMQLVEQKLSNAPAEINKKLCLDNRTKIFWYKGFRTIGRKPYSLFNIYVPKDWGKYFTREEIRGEKRILSIIEKISGMPAIEANQSISASSANQDVAKYLKMKIGDPVLLVERVYFSRGGKPMELAISYVRPDVYQFNIKLKTRNK